MSKIKQGELKENHFEIEIELKDDEQPFRVVKDGKIYYFCRTREEAEKYIKKYVETYNEEGIEL